MTAVELLVTLRARGVELVATGDRLRFRPMEAVTPEELEALRRFKGELVRLLTTPEPLPALDAKTLIEVLGASPTSAEIRAVGREVAAALAQLQDEIRSGQLGPGPVLVRGVPLALWLPLDEVARLLREGTARLPRQRGGAR